MTTTTPADTIAVTRRNPRPTPFWSLATIVLTVLGVLATMNQVFFWNVGGVTLLENTFLYLLLAAFLPIIFIVTPATHGRGGRKERRTAPPPGTGALHIVEADQTVDRRACVPWYDVVLILLVEACCLYFAANGLDIQEYGWEWNAPVAATVLSVVFWILIVEVLRRSAGWIVALLALAFSLYPMIAGQIPIGILQGIDYDALTLAQIHAMGTESILGLPLQTAGTILVGFLLFGTVLQHTGGADFFHNVSTALFGRYRGGSAKVAVASSATMGMMSGSAVSNVLTTGPMTIPAILYFLGIFLQVDAYSAVHGLRGAPRYR